EYKFAELDALENDPMNEMGEPSLQPGSAAISHNRVAEKKDIKRNALIVIGLIIFAMVMYKLLGYLFFSTKTVSVAKTTTTPAAQVATQPTAIQPIQPSIPVQPTVQPVVVTENSSDLNNKVSAIELAQQSVRSEVGSMSQQVDNVNTNVTNLNNQIASLNQTISTLSNQLAKQSEEINLLMARTQPKKIVKPAIRQSVAQVNYYIQAVIPGRAWLIGSNGSTLTVREGTKISGYGMVKLIDSMQGRVITSSGRVIKFSQEDS
ncbi:MAG: type IVB secretion system protein IcmG/DotF, partial [bacterium]|nr:type IVB secretion system protein IcmG/DotF [bacterium]